MTLLTRNRNKIASYLTPSRARNEAVKAIEARPCYLFEIEEHTVGADRGFQVSLYRPTMQETEWGLVRSHVGAEFVGWLKEPVTP